MEVCLIWGHQEVQEEDFVLQVAAPPRYVILGMKLEGGREHVPSHTPVPTPVLLPPSTDPCASGDGLLPPVPSSLDISFLFWAFPSCLGGSRDSGPAALLELVLPVVPPHILPCPTASR